MMPAPNTGSRYNILMPRVGEFCPSNIARFLLTVVIVVTVLLAVGVWLFHSPGHGLPLHPVHAGDTYK
jgi:hypothetical protein